MADLTRRSMLASAAAAVWAWPRADRGPLPSADAGLRLPAAPAADQRPFFASFFLDHDPPLAYVHCPSICELPGGGLGCVWYAGSRETARDVAIYMSEAGPTATDSPAGMAWSMPRPIVDRAAASADLDRYVDKVGNAVLFNDGTGRIWLVYVSIAIGGWSGSSLNARSSTDGGRTWSPSRRLSLSPFFNVSELVRAAPVLLDSGEIALPVYHECLGKFPEMLWLRPQGDRLVATKSRMAGGRTLIQPAVVPLAGRDAIAFLRNHGRAHRLVEQRSADAGRSWSPPQPTPLHNPDASVAAVRLSTGEQLVAFNNSAVNRENLCLAIGGNGDWKLIGTLDQEPGQKFAYPYMIQDGRGLVHLVYTWKMKRVRHVAMNEAWIFSQPREAIG
jgi:predicted neuraminidase